MIQKSIWNQELREDGKIFILLRDGVRKMGGRKMNQEIFDLKPLTKEEVRGTFYRLCQGVVSSKI